MRNLPEGYVSPNFRLTEFMCNHCNLIPYGKPPVKLVMWLEDIRSHFGGRPVIINSAYRCEVHNSNVGGAKGSQHLTADATDFYVKDVSPADVYVYADQLIGDEGGVGKYNTFTHIDCRGHHARW